MASHATLASTRSGLLIAAEVAIPDAPWDAGSGIRRAFCSWQSRSGSGWSCPSARAASWRRGWPSPLMEFITDSGRGHSWRIFLRKERPHGLSSTVTPSSEMPQPPEKIKLARAKNSVNPSARGTPKNAAAQPGSNLTLQLVEASPLGTRAGGERTCREEHP